MRILGALPPILLPPPTARCALARHRSAEAQRRRGSLAKRRGARRLALALAAGQTSAANPPAHPRTNRSTTYADLELSSLRESDAGSAASVEAVRRERRARGEAALSAAPADDVEVEEALAYLQRRDLEAAGPSEAGCAGRRGQR